VNPAAGAGRKQPAPRLVLEADGAALVDLERALDKHKPDVYTHLVIQTLADSETERFYAAGKSRRMPTEIRKRAAMRLLQLNAATRVEDLRLPPSNRLEQLHGDRAGQWSIRINEAMPRALLKLGGGSW
jgi:proteic killer suppression protein